MRRGSNCFRNRRSLKLVSCLFGVDRKLPGSCRRHAGSSFRLLHPTQCQERNEGCEMHHPQSGRGRDAGSSVAVINSPSPSPVLPNSICMPRPSRIPMSPWSVTSQSRRCGNSLGSTLRCALANWISSHILGPAYDSRVPLTPSSEPHICVPSRATLPGVALLRPQRARSPPLNRRARFWKGLLFARCLMAPQASLCSRKSKRS